jgi:putative DNA methylase
VDLPKEYGGGKGTIIAWIWTRTVPSPDPAFADVQVPIASSFLLSSKSGNEAWVEPVVDKVAKTISYRVRWKGTKAEIANAKEGTKAGRAVFRCLLSGAPISGSYVDRQADVGKLGQNLMAVVAEGKGGRVYIDANGLEQAAAVVEAGNLAKTLDATHLEVPCRGTFASNAQGRRYGFKTFADYFTDRQRAALLTFSYLIKDARKKIRSDAVQAGLGVSPEGLSAGGVGAQAYSEAVGVYLAFAVSKLTNLGSSVTSWMSDRGALRETFARQGIPMAWDFAEVNFFSASAGNWLTPIDKISKAVAEFPANSCGKLTQASAQEVKYPENVVISTDPPYYDNIEYADLSDFFFVWLRSALIDIDRPLFGILSTPKAEELVATRNRYKTQEAADEFFLKGMSAAIGRMPNSVSAEFPTTIYYAFKQSEVEQEGISSTGWATFLQAVINSGFSVVGTWPVRTESPGRIVATGTNALANSVVLVCRKKELSAEIITRAEFIRTLKRELPPAIAELQAANIAPADMPQSAIGPGMGVFSRYKSVLESDDSPMSVKAALQLINRELDEYLGGIQGEFDADTRFAVTWFEQNGMAKGDYGTANSIAQARGISVESVKHAGIVESAAGKVRILKRDELALDWDPAADPHLTVWECCQYLIRALETQGEYDAAVLLKKIGHDKADAVKDLAYCLYGICEKRSDAKEATSYNALIAVWAELTRQAAAIQDTRINVQASLDL